ncbi:hypothetical protein QQF64_034217 [Cirrhinus molitorella]|uniref:CxC3 like cysteine cluster domain-containing protein n=1 Tax=Cirrhinus molitorella TaxID=172907 RepID=A0ABR3MW45_9TELE
MASCQNSGFDQLCQEAANIARELELKAANAALEAATREAEQILQTFNPPPLNKRKTKRAGSNLRKPVSFMERDEFGHLVPKRRRPKFTKPNISDGTLIKNLAMSLSLESGQRDIDHDETPSLPRTVPSRTVWPAVEDIEALHQEVEDLLADTEDTQCSNPTSSNTWSIRIAQTKKKWAALRPEMVECLLTAECTEIRQCQHCNLLSAVKTAFLNSFFRPISPTTLVKVDIQGQFQFEETVCLLPLEAPEKICNCATDSIVVSEGKKAILIGIDGRYSVSLPHFTCSECDMSRTTSIPLLIKSATASCETIYKIDVFVSYDHMKLAAPGMSRQSFTSLLEQRTEFFGRDGRICADAFQLSFFE